METIIFQDFQGETRTVVVSCRFALKSIYWDADEDCQIEYCSDFTAACSWSSMWGWVKTD